MRVGINCYPTYGGSGVVATELAKALATRGHEIHLLSYAIPSRLVTAHENVFFHKVEVRPYPLFDYPPYSLALTTKMVEVARRHSLQLMHVHYAVPSAVSAVLARQILTPQHLPVITTLHGTDITLVGSDPSYLTTTKFGIEQSDRVTAVSQSLREMTQEQLGTDRSIEVIPNFVDIEPEVAAQSGLTGERFRRSPEERLVIHVSNFREVKRVMDVVEVFSRVREKVPARLLLVGDGPDRPRVEQRCQELGIDEWVSPLGQLPRIEEVLTGCDLFLLTSESESFGLAALEAMACGVPVVTTDAGGLPEVIKDGRHGFLCPVGDVEAMAESALKLLENGGLWEEFSRAARIHALENYDRDTIVDRYEALYEGVLD